MEASKKGPGKEDPPVAGGETKDPAPPADASVNPTQSQEQTTEPSGDPQSSENPEILTPEEEAQRESEERVRGLLQAYQDTLDFVEELPTIVWVPWGSKRPGSYFKVPYLRWFLTYFVTFHINRSLDALNRRYEEIAALSDDLNANRKIRETIKVYLESLPRPPYRALIFAAFVAALVVALPLQAFGNPFYVLDLAGALLRFNIGYVGRALDGNDLGPTLRSLTVLVIGLIVVGAILTSPFGLKRILFNLHPWSTEPLDSTAARKHGYRVEGLYTLEEGVFEEAGIRRPHEGRWDLAFQTFLVSILFLVWLILAALTLLNVMGGRLILNVDTGAPADVQFFLPEVSWEYYALVTVMVLAMFILLSKRLIAAWKKRSRNVVA